MTTEREYELGTPRAPVEDLATLRVSLATESRLLGDEALTVGPGPGHSTRPPTEPLPGPQPPVIVDGRPESIRLERHDPARAVLVEGDGLDAWRTRVVFERPRPGQDGRERREVVVDGWRFEVEVESERRARLRERAQAVAGRTGAGAGRAEIRAMIPGRVVEVDVAAGQSVERGDRLLVLEAMKMQNEVQAERSGAVQRVDVAAGDTVELGDVLVVME